jgi:hypothetical protein
MLCSCDLLLIDDSPYFNRAPNQTQYEAAMASILDTSTAMHEYLTNLEGNWQLFDVLAKGLRLYNVKSDNVVEQWFSWCLEQRHLPFSLFLSEFFDKLFQKHCRDKIACDKRKNDLLTAKVSCCLTEVQTLYERGNRYRVSVTDATLGKANVTYLSEIRGKSSSYTVDFDKPISSRCCSDYSEDGWVCAHAYAVIRELKWHQDADKGPKWFYSKDVLGIECFQSTVADMFSEVKSLLGTLPCEMEIENAMRADDLKTIKYATYINNDITSSGKRHLSTGERPNSKKRVQTENKVQCICCHVFFGKKYLNTKGPRGHTQGGAQCLKNKQKYEHRQSMISANVQDES